MIIRQCVDYYLMGELELPALYPTIVRALADKLDAVQAAQMDTLMRTPFNHVLPTK